MGKDHPDWGGMYVDAQNFPLFDLGELAARLSSPVTYDRRGNVLWLYDFGYGLDQVETYADAPAAALLSVTRMEIGAFSLYLASGAEELSHASVVRRVPRPRLDNVGFQISVNFATDTGVFAIELYEYDGSNLNRAGLKVDMDNRELSVNDRDAGWTAIVTGLPDYSDGYYFVHLKLVVNLATHKYVRAMVDSTEHDLSAYTMTVEGGDASPHLYCRGYLYSATGENAIVYVDSLIVTGGEPD